DPCTRNEAPLTLSWERILRLDSGVRVNIWDTIQIENAVSTISQEYLLEFTSEYGIPESLHPELPGPKEPIVEFSEGKVGVYTKFFEFANFRISISQFLFDILGHYQIHLSQLSVIGTAKVDEKIFPTVVEWRTNALKDEMPSAGSYSVMDVTILNTHCTPIQKQPEALLCLVGLSRRYFLRDDVASNPINVKTETRPRTAHEVPLLTDTIRRVIDMEDTVVAGEEATTKVIPESSLEKEVAAMGPVVNKRRHKRRNEGAGANAPPKVLTKDYAASHPAQSTRGEKSIVIIGLNVGSTFSMPIAQDVPSVAKIMSDPDPMSYAKPQPHPERDISQSSKEMASKVPTRHVATTKVQGGISAKSPKSVKSTHFLSVDGSPEGIYQPGWGVTNNYRLDTPDTCQDMVDHVVPPGYFSELRHLPNTDILSHYNMNLARQRIKAREEEIKKLDHEIKSLRTVEMELHGLRNQTKNLETLLEAEVDMKQTTKAKNTRLAKELESLFTGEERIKAAFEEFTKYEDHRVNSRCAEIDARFDALSIDFDKELYPHMLTTIAGRRWVIGAWSTSSCYESLKLRQVFADVVFAGVAKGMSEGLKHRIEHGKANLDLAAIEAYDPEADAKYVTAL
nr:transposase (putative), gypsy type [Tanacetum cinerariifolium]